MQDFYPAQWPPVLSLQTETPGGHQDSIAETLSWTARNGSPTPGHDHINCVPSPQLPCLAQDPEQKQRWYCSILLFLLCFTRCIFHPKTNKTRQTVYARVPLKQKLQSLLQERRGLQNTAHVLFFSFRAMPDPGVFTVTNRLTE